MAYFGCIKKSASPLERTFKSEYEIIFDEVYGLSNGRTYKKVNPSEEDTCIVGAFYYRSGNYVYGDPFCLIGLNATDPVYKSSYNNQPFPYLGTIKRAGKTFYYSNSQQFYNNGSLESNPANKIIAINTISTPFSSYLEGVSALLNLALVNGAEALTYKWDFTKSVDPLIDEIICANVDLRNGAQLTSEGVSFTGRGQCIVLPSLSETFFVNKTIELDIAKFDFKGDTSKDINFFVVPNDTNYTDTCILCWMNSTQWSVCGATSTSGTGRRASSSFNSNLNRNSFDNKTIKLTTKRPSTGYDIFKLYINNELMGTVNDIYIPYLNSSNRATIGSRYDGSGTGDQSYDCIISGIRIYPNEEV